MNELKQKILQNKKPLFVACVVFLVIFGFLYNSISGLIHNKREHHRLIKLSLQLDKQQEQLTEQLALLKQQDPAYIERLARVKYHMSKPGEVEFRFKKK